MSYGLNQSLKYIYINYKNQKTIKVLIPDKNNKEYKFNISNNDGAPSSILKKQIFALIKACIK